MEIVVGKTAGTCYGVQRAIEEAIKYLKQNKAIYCLGELVHNKQVTQALVKQGMIFIDKIEDAKGKVIIRAHGEPKRTYEKAKKMGIKVIDLTCPNVLKIHKIAEEYTKNNYYIFITGKKEHPETVGIVGFCGSQCFVIEKKEDCVEAIENFEKSKFRKVLLISQTTFNLEKFNEMEKFLKSKLKNRIEVINTICTATKLRQEETEKLSKQVDAMIIIGGKHSSNTNKLYDIASKNCKKVSFVETDDELDLKEFKDLTKIGIMAGASTPKESVAKVIEILKNIC